MPTTAPPTEAWRAVMMSNAEIRKAWGRQRGPVPEIGDIVGWQLDAGHEVFYGFVRRWRKPTHTCLVVTLVGQDDRTFPIDPRDVVVIYRHTKVPGE
jgi:hypothetical protein